MIYTDAQKVELLKDPAWLDIGNLPSNFYPYTFTSLHIRPFKVSHLKLLSKAILLKDIRHQIQAIDSVITEDATKLTIGDYYYILQWLKLHSTTKTPLAVEWHCPEQRLKNKETSEFISNNPKILQELAPTLIADEYELVSCKTHNTELLHQTDLDIIQLPEDDWQGLPEGFDFPRVSILQEVREALASPELNMLVGAAQWVPGNTLADKIKLLEDQDNLDMFTTAQAINDTVIHGIKETAILHCRTCQAEHQYTISIDSLSFFQ